MDGGWPRDPVSLGETAVGCILRGAGPGGKATGKIIAVGIGTATNGMIGEGGGTTDTKVVRDNALVLLNGRLCA